MITGDFIVSGDSIGIEGKADYSGRERVVCFVKVSCTFCAKTKKGKYEVPFKSSFQKMVCFLYEFHSLYGLMSLAGTRLRKMYSLSRALARTSIQSLKTVGNKKAFVSRGMSTILDSKEHAEESRFIRQIEAKQQAEVRAKLEAILALEDHHEEKKELVGLLGE